MVNLGIYEAKILTVVDFCLTMLYNENKKFELEKMGKKIILKGKKIPKFKSYEEEANFWDTHSPLDYGTWKEIKLEVAKPLEHILGVRMDGDTLTKLTKLGSEIGVGPSTLVRIWIMEKLKSLSRRSKYPKGTSQAVLHKIALKETAKQLKKQ